MDFADENLVWASVGHQKWPTEMVNPGTISSLTSQLKIIGFDGFPYTELRTQPPTISPAP